MADGKIVFQIVAEATGIKSAIDEVTRSIASATSGWDQEANASGENISTALIGAFQKVTTSVAFVKITKMLLDLGVESINLASDLEEVQNVVDVTFGPKGSAQIEEWAQTASKNFGLTELQAKRYASTMGAMMKSSGMTGDKITKMSMSIAELAADMSSFYNMDFDDMFAKIRSGLSGETEPLTLAA